MAMKKNLFLMVAFLCCNPVSAFDTETHALITRAAYSRSVLGSGSVYYALGLSRLDLQTPLNLYWSSNQDDTIPYYYSDGSGLLGYSSSMFFPEPFERCQMQEFLYPQVDSSFTALFSDTVSNISSLDESADTILPIQNWIVRGAIREDDTGFIALNLTSIHCANEYAHSSKGINPRSLNHFYDPYSNIGLLGLNPRAVDWALGYVDSFSPSPVKDDQSINNYSYAIARDTFWWALTREKNLSGSQSSGYTAALRQMDAEDRMHLWATTFRSLGDVMHLLEDMAQPQHTRNDTHSAIDSPEKQAFEDYTNDRVLGTTDEIDNYVRGFFGQIEQRFPPPPLGAYQEPMFATPERFFSTQADGTVQLARYGLADYSNRGFFTGGTLPDVTSEPLPPALDTSYTIVVVPCEELSDLDSRVQSVTCAHYTHSVPDVWDASYADVLPTGFSQAPLASDSIFRQIGNDGAGTGSDSGTSYIPKTVLGIAELDTIGNLTIPRAVAYATGMVDYFFRGQLALSSPPDGLYAVLDQGTPHQVSSDGIPQLPDGVNTFGFKTVRVRVKNNTMIDSNGQPTLNDAAKGTVPQTMRAGFGPDGSANGYLVAVARYHRNSCYQPDLSGEYVTTQFSDGHVTNTVPAGCNSSQMRSTYPEISVSKAVSLDTSGTLISSGTSTSQCANVGNINSGAGSETGICENASALLEFDFSSDPIPVNATDLFLQVAYRGQLGTETDGIAVGMVDLMEPNYFSVVNNTDWTFTGAGGTQNLVQNWATSSPSDIVPVTVQACFNSESLISGQVLNPREFMRLAVLTDQPVVSTGTIFDSGHSVGGAEYLVPRQSDRENGGTFINYVYSPYFDINFGMTYFRGAITGYDWYINFPDTDTTGLNTTGTLASSGVAEQLQPDIGNAQGAVAPVVTSGLQFISSSDGQCAAAFPGPYPGFSTQSQVAPLLSSKAISSRGKRSASNSASH